MEYSFRSVIKSLIFMGISSWYFGLCWMLIRYKYRISVTRCSLGLCVSSYLRGLVRSIIFEQLMTDYWQLDCGLWSKARDVLSYSHMSPFIIIVIHFTLESNKVLRSIAFRFLCRLCCICFWLFVPICWFQFFFHMCASGTATFTIIDSQVSFFSSSSSVIDLTPILRIFDSIIILFAEFCLTYCNCCFVDSSLWTQLSCGEGCCCPCWSWWSWKG